MSPEFLSSATSATVPSSVSPRASAKALLLYSSSTSIWPRSNERSRNSNGAWMSGTTDPSHISALIAELRRVPAFADQEQADLEWFVSQSDERRTEVGGITVKEDTPADTMFVILQGEFLSRLATAPH